MKKTVLILITALALFAQEKQKDISVISYVKVLDGNMAEALYYFENNWMQFRIYAKEKGFIKSYSLFKTLETDSNVDIILITEYENKAQHDEIEDRFKEFMKDRSKDNKYLNEKTKNEIRKTISIQVAEKQN